MIELKRQRFAVLRIAEVVCFAMMLLPTWQTVALRGGGEQTVIQFGLPFSPWHTGTQTWFPAEVAGAWDYHGDIRIHFWSWTWSLLLLGIGVRFIRKGRHRTPHKALNLRGAQ